MSAKAVVSAKAKSVARNGERLTTGEQLLLLYIADCYNDEKRAAWCGVPRMARDNGLSHRRIQEIIGELVRKQEIWREPRYHDATGREMSNWYRFYEFDGEPPTEVLIWEQQNRIRGELAKQRLSGVKNEGGNPQKACESGCESPQGAGAKFRVLAPEESHREGAKARVGTAQEFAPGGCGSSHREDAGVRTQNFYLNNQYELPHEPPLEPKLNVPIEAPSAAAVEKDFKNAWPLILTNMMKANLLSDQQFLDLSLDTYQRRCFHSADCVVLQIGIRKNSMPLLELCMGVWIDFIEHKDSLRVRLWKVGINVEAMKLALVPPETKGPKQVGKIRHS